MGATEGRPLTGVSPREAARRVASVDLDAPLGAGPEALAELSRLWLDDAIWFHEPRTAAHLNCPARAGTTAELMAHLLAHVFADPAVRRIVLEPDVANEKALGAAPPARRRGPRPDARPAPEDRAVRLHPPAGRALSRAAAQSVLAPPSTSVSRPPRRAAGRE